MHKRRKNSSVCSDEDSFCSNHFLHAGNGQRRHTLLNGRASPTDSFTASTEMLPLGHNDKDIHEEIKLDFIRTYLRGKVMKRLSNKDKIIIQNSMKTLTL